MNQFAMIDKGTPSPYVIPGLLRGKLDESIVIKEVCKYYDQPQTIVFRRYMRQDLHIRQVVMYIISRKLHLDFVTIGKLFKVHRTTVMYAVKYVDGQLTAKHNNMFKSDVPIILDRIRYYY